MHLNNMNVIEDPCQYMMDEAIVVVLYFDAKLISLKHVQHWARFFDPLQMQLLWIT